MKFKKLLAAIAVTAILCFSPQIFSVTSNYTSYVDGQVLTASSLNSLQTNYTNADNAILDGDTFTGTIQVNSGFDVMLYSDAGTTLKAAIYGDSGRIIGYQDKPGVYNIDIISATTTNAGDSVTVQCGGAACSATNPGFVVMNATGAGGAYVVFAFTANVTQLLTGAHWGMGTNGDITGVLIRALFVNDNGTLRTCFALLGGRQTVLTTDTTATQTSVTTPEGVLCNTAVASATNTVLDYGYFRSNFDDTGGVAEDLFANQTGVGDFVTGRTADGIYQPATPVESTAGWSTNPVTWTNARWTQIGRTIHFNAYGITGTSDSTSTDIKLPATAAYATRNQTGIGSDNGGAIGEMRGDTSAGSRTLTLYTSMGAAGWTASGTKNVNPALTYEVGPAASFIE